MKLSVAKSVITKALHNIMNKLTVMTDAQRLLTSLTALPPRSFSLPDSVSSSEPSQQTD